MRPRTQSSPPSPGVFSGGPRAPPPAGPRAPAPPPSSTSGFGRGRPQLVAAPPFSRTRVGSAASRVGAAHPGPRRAAGCWPGPGTHRSIHGLVALGALGGHGRCAPVQPVSSARARLPAAAASPAPPAPPDRLSVLPLVCVRGGASGARPRGPGAAGAGAHLQGRMGGDWTRRAPLGRAREVASTQARPVLACFHGNVGAASRAAGGAGSPRPPRLGASWPAGASARKGGVGTSRLTPRRRTGPPCPVLAPGSPREPYPTLPRAATPLPFVARFL